MVLEVLAGKHLSPNGVYPSPRIGRVVVRLGAQGQDVTINDLRTLRIKEDQVTVQGIAKLEAGARDVIGGKRYKLDAEVIELTGTNSITLTVGQSWIKIDDEGVTLVSADGKRIKLN